MAVKQKVIECVGQTKEARLQIILRALQSISAQDGLQDKICANIVKSLGTVPIPSDAISYMKFIEDIKKVQDILAKECCHKKHTFIALKALYDEISNPDPSRQPSPAMSIVLQLIDVASIPNAVKYILNTGYPEQNLERAIHTLCNWLKKCAWAENLGPLVLAFMEGLEAEHHYDILIDVTLAEIEPLFKLVMFPKIRQAVGPVVLYMLSRNQHNPQVFHKIVPLAATVCGKLDQERSTSSMIYLQDIVNMLMALMDHFPGYPELYHPLNEVLEPFYNVSDYKQALHCKSWVDIPGSSGLGKFSMGKVGLINLGNTCYMNSVLQALFMTKTFRNEVLLYNKEISQLFTKLQDLFALLQFSTRASLSPNEILNISRPPGFLQGQQHDSSEFLGYLLDTLHEQESNFTSNASSSEDGATSVVPTVVQQSFGGKTLTISRCGVCGTKSERVDSFRELQLSFPNHSENQTVQTLMEYYLQPEKLTGDNQYHCDQCSSLTDSERITRIVEAPARLTLTLKHFRYDPASHQRTKLLQSVTLDEHLTLDNCRYELYAAVVHCGSSVDSGHYYTLAKDKEDWFKFNDSYVSKATTDSLSRLKPPETPYILFYSREDVSDLENLPATVLSHRLQILLSKDNSQSEQAEGYRSVKLYSVRQDRDDEPPPPGCGGGGFSSTADGGASAVIPTLVQQTFGGKTLTISECGECGNRSERVDNFRELQLSFPNNTENQTVLSLLDYYLQPELLTGDNQYHCDQCGKLTDSEKITKVVESPAQLILTLKRFRYEPVTHKRTKLLRAVVLDDHLVLNNFYYKLYAVVIHGGSSIDSGHYYTFAQDDSEWYKFNDGSVTIATRMNLSNLRYLETPYMLFYTREDVAEFQNISADALPARLQEVLALNNSEFDQGQGNKSEDDSEMPEVEEPSMTNATIEDFIKILPLAEDGGLSTTLDNLDQI